MVFYIWMPRRGRTLDWMLESVLFSDMTARPTESCKYGPQVQDTALMSAVSIYSADFTERVFVCVPDYHITQMMCECIQWTGECWMGLRVVGKGSSIGCVIEAHNDPDPAFISYRLLFPSISFYYPAMVIQPLRCGGYYKSLPELSQSPACNILFGLIKLFNCCWFPLIEYIIF